MKARFLLAFQIIAISLMAQNEPFSPDLQFGQNGFTHMDFDPCSVLDPIYKLFFNGHDLWLRTDGKICIASSSESHNLCEYPNYTYVACFNENGEPFQEFGNNGGIQIKNGNLGGIYPTAQNGFFVYDFHEDMVYKYDEDGIWDSSFGDLSLNHLRYDQDFRVLAVLADQTSPELLLAMGTSDSLFLMQFLQNGALDSSFSPVKIPNALNSSFATVLSRYPDGKILLATCELSFANVEIEFEYKLRKYLPNGQPDTSWGSNGEKSLQKNHLVPFSPWPSPRKILLGPNDEIYVHFRSWEGESYLVKYLNSGALDPDFSKINFTDGQKIIIWEFYVQPDGKLILSGNNTNGIFLARFNSNGIIDSGFGENGYIPWDGYGAFEAVLDEKKRLLVAMNAPLEEQSNRLTLARFITDITADVTQRSNPSWKNMVVSPNPVSKSASTIELRGELASSSAARFLVTDLYGKTLAEQNQYIESGRQLIEIPIPQNLPAGLYLLQILTDQCSHIFKFYKE